MGEMQGSGGIPHSEKLAQQYLVGHELDCHAVRHAFVRHLVPLPTLPPSRIVEQPPPSIIGTLVNTA